MACTRRDFVKWTALGAALPLASCVKASRSNQVGYAMIAFPDEQFVEALPVVANLGYDAVQIRSDVEKTYVSKPAALKAKLDALKLKPLALSFSAVPLEPAKQTDTTAKFREFTNFHRQIGGTFVQITDGGKPDTNYPAADIKAYGDYLNDLGKIAIDSGLTMTYHPHMGSMGETRDGLDRLMAATDPRYLKLQPDVGHMTLGCMDVPDAIRAYRERLAFFHFKDALKDVLEQAREDRSVARKAKYKFCEVGTGGVDFPGVLRAMDDAHFNGWIIVEVDGYRLPPAGPAEAARTNQLAMRKMGFDI